jgi:hypothetical protein
MKEQRKKQSALLRDYDQTAARESVELERVLSVFDNDPEQWVEPLLAEGMNLDRIFELVVQSILRPN